MNKPALLALEDGSLFWGEALGARKTATAEVVFNTALTGYQEIMTDPSYAGQMIVFTTPHIGIVGVNAADEESKQIWASGIIMRAHSSHNSNWRAEKSLEEYLQEQDIAGISGIDTRALTLLLRSKGNLKGCLMTAEINPVQAVKLAQESVCQSSAGTTSAYTLGENRLLSKPALVEKIDEFSADLKTDFEAPVQNTGPKKLVLEMPKSIGFSNQMGFRKKSNKPHHVVVIDFGIKQAILNSLLDSGCFLTVLPSRATLEEVLSHHPDGIFLSNGPGDPKTHQEMIGTIAALIEKGIPLFGICLGHQLLALASGAETEKMALGHHGANHPIIDLETRSVFISSQNHNFVVSENSLPSSLKITHRSLFDGTIAGIARTDKPAFGFQGHPEASPGPHELGELFSDFVHLMEMKNAEAL